MSIDFRRASRARGSRAVARVAALLIVAAPIVVRAQTDYYNTDPGRPLRIEDAYAIEHRGLELRAAPLRLERSKGGLYRWGLEPALAAGILPRTELEVAVPIAYIDRRLGRGVASVAGVDVSVLHNLNVETSLPAFGVRAGVLLPAGALGPGKAYPSLTGIATKTFPWARFHANGQYAFGDARSSAAPTIGAAGHEASRWMAGLAVDKTFPLRSLLATAELYAQRPLPDGTTAEWNAGVGSRYQLTPRWAIDGGVGRRLNGDDRAWYLTAGGAWAFGMPWRTR